MASPTRSTPLRRRRRRSSSPPEESITVNTPPQAQSAAKALETTPEATQTPETRKRQIDFHSLHNFGF
jgi:hypothetical protein